jgi:uncharacterized membrane protein required for colicin V production
MPPVDIALIITSFMVFSGLAAGLRGVFRPLQQGWPWHLTFFAALAAAPVLYPFLLSRMDMPSKDIAMAVGISLVLIMMAGVVAIYVVTALIRLVRQPRIR